MATTAAFVAGQQVTTGAFFRQAERPSNAAGAAAQSACLKQPLQASSASAFATGGSQLSYAARPEHKPARAPKTVAKKISAAVSTAAPAQGERQAQTAKKPVETKRTVIITGASSGLGLATAKKLAKSGEWHVILACRDFLKAERAAKAAGLPKDSYTTLHIDLSSLESVRQFVKHFRATERKLDVLVANAAVYLPTAKEPRFTAEGFELSVGTNHLGHFLLVNLLLEDLEKNREAKPRVIIVGSITGNTNTLAGNVPPKANLGDLSGLAAGLSENSPSVMIDGGEFDGAKAYKDSKVCNMLTVRELHRRYHEKTGITFSSLYPGCIAETGLFREHYGIFKTLFPLFQKYVTKGYVSEDTAGERLAQVVSDPKLGASGNYWSWNNDQSSFVNDVSDEVADSTKGQKLWEVSEKLVGLK